MVTLNELNLICDIRDLLKHLNLSVSIILTHDPESVNSLWAVEVQASVMIEGASYGTLRQTPWFPEDKTFTEDRGEWEREIDSLAMVIAVAMGRRVFTR